MEVWREQEDTGNLLHERDELASVPNQAICEANKLCTRDDRPSHGAIGRWSLTETDPCVGLEPGAQPGCARKSQTPCNII